MSKRSKQISPEFLILPNPQYITDSPSDPSNTSPKKNPHTHIPYNLFPKLAFLQRPFLAQEKVVMDYTWTCIQHRGQRGLWMGQGLYKWCTWWYDDGKWVFEYVDRDVKEGGEEVHAHQSHNDKNYIEDHWCVGERVRRTTTMRIRAREMFKIAVCAILPGRGGAGVVTTRAGIPSMRVALMICRVCGVGIPCGSDGNILTLWTCEKMEGKTRNLLLQVS